SPYFLTTHHALHPFPPRRSSDLQRRTAASSMPDTPSKPVNQKSLLRSDLPFPVVGIGASAGGIEALKTFFKHMPAEPGMAFVVVDRKSTRLNSSHVKISYAVFCL